MREERIVSALQRALGFVMILAGIGTAAVELARGNAPAQNRTSRCYYNASV